jgi:hypothetical protein
MAAKGLAPVGEPNGMNGEVPAVEGAGGDRAQGLGRGTAEGTAGVDVTVPVTPPDVESRKPSSKGACTVSYTLLKASNPPGRDSMLRRATSL